jgi:uncharacterized protein with PQ loop repeat
MKRLYWEILFVILFVVGGTIVVYNQLIDLSSFWDSQSFWSTALMICWAVVTFGYYHQGWLVHEAKSSAHVSIVLPITVFFAQCILFVKGVYYQDYALMVGAVLVNSGVVFNLYQIKKYYKNN